MWNSLSFGAWPYRIGQQIDPKFEMETLNDFRGLMIQNVLGPEFAATCGKSYKHSTIVIYDSRVVQTIN